MNTITGVTPYCEYKNHIYVKCPCGCNVVFCQDCKQQRNEKEVSK